MCLLAIKYSQNMPGIHIFLGNGIASAHSQSKLNEFLIEVYVQEQRKFICYVHYICF